jgi:rubrerythrin
MIFGFNADEVFQVAIEIEENGKIFYDKALEMVDDPQVRNVFKDLALQETEHKRKFQELKQSLPSDASSGTVQDPDHQLADYIKMMADQHVFRTSAGLDQRLQSVTNTMDALRLAIEFEKDSVIFFLSMKDATDESQGRELISLLVKEEQEHLRRLTLELKKVTG